MSFWNKEQPLGLPKGSVRAIIALGVVLSAVYMLARGKLDPETFVMITAVITGFYFVSKKE